ncbi:hypothetical protein C4K68_21705 [Pokkaliibacter plantistimulans]|uniref:Uncharacterized protein n=1 Tax=Proteobacteria bacterium 228 TaxID=2083153 RepID=A0A2S5KK87_9PROT|nr:cysteine-rich CWC family protein [Pokkaliibacter plantistimulans]PPC75254.1 hypothetical protein C4K68_21705 [Pokkaliibacter plantistimulans]
MADNEAAGTCPLCGGPNYCAFLGQMPVHTVQEQVAAVHTCWCYGVDFSQALLGLAALQGGTPSCICELCVRKSELHSESDSEPAATEPWWLSEEDHR